VLGGTSGGQVWFTWYKRNRTLPYDREKGAGYYLTKYVIKEENDSALFTITGLEYVNQLYLRGIDRCLPVSCVVNGLNRDI